MARGDTGLLLRPCGEYGRAEADVGDRGGGRELLWLLPPVV